MKEPLRMLVQFMPTLAEPIERCEEGTRIARVNLDGAFEVGADLPDGVELRVVDR